jgi:hypothetical protein
VKFSARPSILLNNKEYSPLGGTKGGTSPLVDKFQPRGHKFTPKGEIHPWGPGLKLRMGLCLMSSNPARVKIFEENIDKLLRKFYFIHRRRLCVELINKCIGHKNVFFKNKTVSWQWTM